MKKSFFIPLVLIVITLIFAGCFSSKVFKKADAEIPEFRWIPEESHFVDYEIQNDKVIFSYSICFVNDSNEDISVAVSAQFKKAEIKNWIQYESFFMGYDEKGNMKYQLVKAQEKKNVVFYFEGKYVSDNVNTNLSFPDELILTTR